MADTWYNQCVLFSIKVLDHMKMGEKKGPSFELLEVRRDTAALCVSSNRFLAQGLAQSVQTFHLDDRGDGYPKAIEKLLQDGQIGGGRNYERNYKSQVITKYMLLDRVATALGCTSGETSSKSRVPFTEVIHDRLKPIVQGTSQWHRIGREMQTHLISMTNHEEELFAGPMPANLDARDQTFCRNLGWLWGAHSSFLKADVAIAEGNLQLMAFMLHWHATVRSSKLREMCQVLTLSPSEQYPVPREGPGIPRNIDHVCS